jgi:hypothetical protein
MLLPTPAHQRHITPDHDEGVNRMRTPLRTGRALALAAGAAAVLLTASGCAPGSNTVATAPTGAVSTEAPT